MEHHLRVQTLGVFALCAAMLVVSGCADKRPTCSLVDGTYELRVDREWRGGWPTVDSPVLPEKSYAAVEDGPTYTIVISEGTKQVSVDGGEGELLEKNDQYATYFVQIVMGATLRVWPTFTGLQAELTLNGSGVPVIRSERGELVRIK